HLEETKQHKTRLEEIAEDTELDIDGFNSKGMQGLVNQAQSFISEKASDSVKDAGIIADAQRVEHYEISAYGTALQYAKSLKQNEAVDKLKATLNEEKQADSILNKVAESSINKEARGAEGL